MSFTLDLRRFNIKAKRNADAVVRKIVMDLGTRIVEKSPVGDPSLWQSPPPAGYVGGRFRANWQYGFNHVPVGDLPGIDATGQVSINRIAAVFGSPAAGIHYLTNNLPYAQRLEDGWSTQAPAGMVGLTIVEFQNSVNKAVREVAR